MSKYYLACIKYNVTLFFEWKNKDKNEKKYKWKEISNKTIGFVKKVYTVLLIKIEHV